MLRCGLPLSQGDRYASDSGVASSISPVAIVRIGNANSIYSFSRRPTRSRFAPAPRGHGSVQPGMTPLQDVPRRVFLDTCVVNFMLDHGEQIYDGGSIPADANQRVARDIEAMSDIMFVGKRAMWQLAISPHTYQEIAATRDGGRRHRLDYWFEDLWQYWLGIIHENDDLPSFVEAEDTRVRLLGSGILDVLSDMADRVLVCDAVVYRCDVFCTRDWATILKHRDHLSELPLRIVTPVEWWSSIQPYARLWV